MNSDREQFQRYFLRAISVLALLGMGIGVDFALVGRDLALAWTTSYFLLMFPGFWYAGKPIGLGIGSLFAVIWKFFVASTAAGCTTFLIISAMPYFAMVFGTPSAFVRMVAISLVFFALYVCGVIALHNGLQSLCEDSVPEICL